MLSDGRIVIYLASPFFNLKQTGRVKHLTMMLEGNGFKVMSPSRDGIVVKPDSTKEAWSEAFDWNVKHLIESDIILANIDDRDTGTSWEMGAGYLAGTPVVTNTGEGHGANLMLLNSTFAHTVTDAEVLQVITVLARNIQKCWGMSSMSDFNLEKKRVVTEMAVHNAQQDLLTEGFIEPSGLLDE